MRNNHSSGGHSSVNSITNLSTPSASNNQLVGTMLCTLVSSCHLGETRKKLLLVRLFSTFPNKCPVDAEKLQKVPNEVVCGFWKCGCDHDVSIEVKCFYNKIMSTLKISYSYKDNKIAQMGQETNTIMKILIS